MESRKTWEQGSRLTFCFLLSLLPGHLLITSKGQVKHLFINILYHLPKNNCLNKSACTISPCRNMKEAVCGIKMWIFYQSDSKTTVFYSYRWQCLMVLLIQYSFSMQRKQMHINERQISTSFKNNVSVCKFPLRLFNELSFRLTIHCALICAACFTFKYSTRALDNQVVISFEESIMCSATAL